MDTTTRQSEVVTVNDENSRRGDQVRAGGRWFLSMREKRGDTLRDIDRATGVSQQNISSIELGRIIRPSMEMLVQLGAYYGVTPNEIARQYGWWQGAEAEKPKDPRLIYLEQTLERLSPGGRHNLLQQIQALAQLAE